MPRPRLSRRPLRAALALLFAGGLVGVLTRAHESGRGEGDPPPRPPPALVLVAPLTQAPPPILGRFALDEEAGRWTAPWGPYEARLTLDPLLQRTLSETLERGRPMRGATVLLEADTGRVLALVGFQEGRLDEAAALVAFAPAASIFKITSVAALLRAGVKPEQEVCYSGGLRRLQPKHLLDDPRRDHRCVTVSDVLPFSVNAAVAKLVDKHLEPAALDEEARRFGFDTKVPFPRPVEVSLAHIPSAPFERAKAAAGFGEVRISALHGALIASVPANGGLLVPPLIIDTLSGGEGPDAVRPTRVTSPRIAAQLSAMMERTVSAGTGSRAFADRGKGLRDVTVAGKTGSLTDYEGGADYSWFVGYAPVDRPRVIVAAVIENDVRLWYVRAPEVARQALESYFRHPPPTTKGKKRAAP
jgi:penicillin-binding protein A